MLVCMIGLMFAAGQIICSNNLVKTIFYSPDFLTRYLVEDDAPIFSTLSVLIRFFSCVLILYFDISFPFLNFSESDCSMRIAYRSIWAEILAIRLIAFDDMENGGLYILIPSLYRQLCRHYSDNGLGYTVFEQKPLPFFQILCRGIESGAISQIF